MRKLFLMIGLVIASVTSVSAQAKVAVADDEQAVLRVTNEWLAAEERGDRATLQRIIADDFQGTAPMGNTVFKEDVMPLEGTREGGLSITTSDVKVRMFGDAAIVTAGGMQKSGEKRALRFTVVFTKRNEAWQMVAGHLSAVPTR